MLPNFKIMIFGSGAWGAIKMVARLRQLEDQMSTVRASSKIKNYKVNRSERYFNW